LSAGFTIVRGERPTVRPEATKSKLGTTSDRTRVACAAVLGDGDGKELEKDKKKKGETFSKE
jgi:hypothetical protein